MSYGTRYETIVKDYANNVLSVHIEKYGYSGSTTHIFEGSNISIKYDGSKDDTNKPIRNSLLNFDFWVRPEQKTDYDSLLESFYKEHRISIYKNKSSLQSILSGQQRGTGIDWNLTGSTVPTVALLNQDSKELTVELTGAHIGLPYVVNYDFNLSMISGFATSSNPIAFTQVGTGQTFVRNSPWNNRWQTTFTANGQVSKELRGEISNAIPFSDYSLYFPTAISNLFVPSGGYVNSTIFRLYATDDTVIDTVQKDYPSQGNKPETIAFNGNAKTPGYFTIQFVFNISNTQTGEFWVYDSSQGINPFGIPFISAGNISGETGSTNGNVIIRLLDENYNVLQTETIPFTGASNYNGQVTFQSDAIVPKYISVEAVHISGDQSVISLNNFALDGAINDHLYWRGFVKPEFLTCTWLSPSFLLSLQATDGLTDLKDLEVPLSAVTNNFLSSLEVVKICLDATGIPLPIRSQVNLNSSEFSGSTLANVFVTGNRFVSVKNGRTVYWTLAEALERLLKTYKVFIRQESGYWSLCQRNENNSSIYDYDYNTLAELNSQLRNREITIHSIDGDNVNQNPFAILNSDELSKVEPLRLLNVDLFDESSGANMVFNPSFETDLDGWSNSTGATEFDNFFYRDDGDEYGGTLQVVNQAFFGNPNRDCYFDSFPFNVALATGDTLDLSWDMNCAAVTSSGGTATNPNYQIQILDATSEIPIVGFTDGFIYSGWRNYSARWLHTSYTGTCIMRVWVKTPAYYNLTLTDIRFDNFSITATYANEQGFNRWFVAQEVAGNAIKKDSEEFYFSDSFVATTKSVLKYTVTGSTSESWHNYDYSVTGKSIIELWQKEEFLQNARFKDFVRVQIRSLVTPIEVDSIFNVTSKGKKYYVLSVTKDLINNIYDLMIVQRLEDENPNVVFSRGQYSVAGGGSSGGNGGSSGGGSGGAEPTIYFAGNNISIEDNVISVIGITGGTIGAVTDGGNLGSGEGVFASKLVDTLTFKSLTSSNGIALSASSDSINIYFTGATGTGSTSPVTASNGLTKVGDDIRLGGTLTGVTNLNVTSTENLVIDGYPLEYAADYSADMYTNQRLLVDGGYVSGYTTYFVLPQQTGNTIAFKSDLGYGPTLDGCNTFVFNPSSRAVHLGVRTGTTGQFSFAIGCNNRTSGAHSVAIGCNNSSTGIGSLSIGVRARANGCASLSQGCLTYANGNFSHAEGGNTCAIGACSHAEGSSTFACGTSSHAEGSTTIACGSSSHAEGKNTLAFSSGSHAEGFCTCACGSSSHAEGFCSKTFSNYSHAEGRDSLACGLYSHAEGEGSVTSGNSSHAEGRSTIAIGYPSHSEGTSTCAIGDNSHAEGHATCACGLASNSKGLHTIAKGDYSLSIGRCTISSGSTSFAGGCGTSTNNRVLAGGSPSFNFSHNSPQQVIGHGALSFSSAILGGKDHNIPTGSTGSTVFGGNGIKVSTGIINTVHLPRVRIGLGVNGFLTSGSTSNNVLVRNNTTGEIEIRSALTLSGGTGGITNGAANTELAKSNGTNLVNSKIFIPSNGDLHLGDDSFSGGTRYIRAKSSGTNTNLYLSAEAGGFAYLVSDSNILLTSGNGLKGIIIDTSNDDVIVLGGGTIKSVANSSGLDLTVEGGEASAGNGGDLNLKSGAGTGTDGNINIDALTGYLILSNIPTSSAGLPTGAVWSNSGVLTIV